MFAVHLAVAGDVFDGVSLGVMFAVHLAVAGDVFDGVSLGVLFPTRYLG